MLSPLSSGPYVIEPTSGNRVSTYCDFDRYGGGWTLLLTRSTSTGWTSTNVLSRNAGSPSLIGDFSALDTANTIKNLDSTEVSIIFSMIEQKFENIVEIEGIIVSYLIRTLICGI